MTIAMNDSSYNLYFIEYSTLPPQLGIQQWRAKIRQLNRESEERTRLLQEERQAIQKHYQQLKQRIHSYR
jgi:hypothetical protein